MTADNITNHGTYLAEVEDISASTFMCKKGLHFLFQEPSKSVPKHTVVWEVEGGSVLKDQKLKVFPYAPTAKTVIYANNDFGPLHDFCGKCVQSVWGRTISQSSKGCGIVVSPKMHQGKPQELFWKPPQDIPMGLAESLMAVGDIEAIFKFNFSQEEAGGMQMAPCGVVFRTTKKIGSKTKTRMISMNPATPDLQPTVSE